MKKKVKYYLVPCRMLNSLHQVDVGHNNLLTVDIDTGDHPSIMQKPYTLVLRHTHWI